MNKKTIGPKWGRVIRQASSAVALLVLPAFALAASSVTLKSIRLAPGKDGVRVEMETSARTESTFFTLEKPHRVVVDFANTQPAKGLRIPAATGDIATIRTGERPKNGFRVVLELKKSAQSRGEWQPAFADVGDRFVVAVGSGTFVASAFQGSGGGGAVEASATPKVVRALHAPADDDRDIVVAIDAGHGGKDPGAIGRNGTMEKNVVLAIARALAARVNAEPGMRAFLVRDDDTYILHRDRMLRARKAKADIFISIHADSIQDRTISGASVYVLNEKGASSEAARWLAERENAADLIGGVKLDDKDRALASVLLDLSQTASISASVTAAEQVLLALDRASEVRKPQVQHAPFLVLKSPDIPSMLVETAYISNPREEARLKSAAHQKKLANAIFEGVRTYFENNPPPGTRLAQKRRGQVVGVLASPAVP